jgi:uncharacterized membrane-anchored protein
MLNLPTFPRVKLTLGTVVSGVSVVALYGLAYERAILSRRFWKAFFSAFPSMFVFVALINVVTVLEYPDLFRGGGSSVPALESEPQPK